VIISNRLWHVKRIAREEQANVSRHETVSCCARKSFGANESERSLDKRFILALESTRAHFYTFKTGSLA